MPVQTDAIRDEVDRLLRSKTFEGSETHRRLLSYLAEKAVSGDGDRLKEYIVALEALGKPPTYDPHHDSSVRIQAGRLRQKLLDYYRHEGVADPIQVSLPKGGFKLVFTRSEEPAHPPNSPAPSNGWRRATWSLAAVAVILASWAAWSTISLVRLQRETLPAVEAWNPELEQLWAPFLRGSRPLLICLGTPLFVRFPEFGFFRDPTSNRWEDLAASQRFAPIRNALHGADSMPWYSFTGAGEASATFLLGKLLATRRRDILLTRSNILSWQEIADNDLVFVGPPKSNVQLQNIPIRQEIAIEAHGIRILKPRPGEPSFLKDYFEAGPQFNGETPALISHTPGLSGRGELLILAGNASSDTLAAAEWLTRPARAKELVAHLRLPSGELPRYYQCVLKVQFKNGIPVNSSYVLHRALQAQ